MHVAREVAAARAALLPGGDAALCLVDDAAPEGGLCVRLTIGACPLSVGQTVQPDDQHVQAGQRLPVRYREHELGALLLGARPDADTEEALRDLLVHFGTALVNLALNSEARRATDDYCATLQALEEGIVLFQEADPEAVAARVLALAANMVRASAGALYVLEEVGNPESELVLRQALGMPEALLASFVAADGGPWPRPLMHQPPEFVGRDEDGGIAGLEPACAPAVLERIAVLPLRYHGVQAGLCLLFNPADPDAAERDCIARLGSFGQLAAALLHRLNLERLREASLSIERELQIAETIQKRLVPAAPPPCDAYDFAWHSLAAKHIGGDYVDFLTSDLGDLYAIVADASGHGVNSALLMTSFRANYRGTAPYREPTELARSLNEEVVHEVGPTGMFITAVMARIEADASRLSLTSAGHNPAMLLRAATGAVERIDSHGPPMGFVAGAEFGSTETTLASGDVLLLYTDGVTEACDADERMFGEDRLEEVLRRAGVGSAQQVLHAALDELASFTGRAQHEDDVTLLVVKAR